MPETSWLASPTAACDSASASLHDLEDPTGRLLFNALTMVAEFEADLIRARTRGAWPAARPAVACAARPGSFAAQPGAVSSGFSGPRAHRWRTGRGLRCQSGHRLPCCPACRRSMSTIDVEPEQVPARSGWSVRGRRPGESKDHYPLDQHSTPQRTEVWRSARARCREAPWQGSLRSGRPRFDRRGAGWCGVLGRGRRRHDRGRDRRAVPRDPAHRQRDQRSGSEAELIVVAADDGIPPTFALVSTPPARPTDDKDTP